MSLTPGPWTVEFVRITAAAPIQGFVINAEESLGKWHSIASQNAYESKNNACFEADEIEANARLIAAAPDLLEAAETALSELRSIVGVATDCFFCGADRAQGHDPGCAGSALTNAIAAARATEATA